MESLITLSARNLPLDDVAYAMGVSMDPLFPTQLSREAQLNLHGCFFESDGNRIKTMTKKESNGEFLHVVYNNKSPINRESSYYPTDSKWHKYCGQVSSVILLNNIHTKGKYTEYYPDNSHIIVDLICPEPITKGKKETKWSPLDSFPTQYNWIIHGNFLAFYPNGSIEISGKVDDDVPYGTWTKYGSKTSKIMMEYNFNNVGKLHGKQLIDNYARTTRFEMYDGKLHGWCIHTPHYPIASGTIKILFRKDDDNSWFFENGEPPRIYDIPKLNEKLSKIPTLFF
jgi:antitoxin component YwqK of YwqJK toxin-antitoxin module